jgi:hypothetical protein
MVRQTEDFVSDSFRFLLGVSCLSAGFLLVLTFF